MKILASIPENSLLNEVKNHYAVAGRRSTYLNKSYYQKKSDLPDEYNKIINILVKKCIHHENSIYIIFKTPEINFINSNMSGANACMQLVSGGYCYIHTNKTRGVVCFYFQDVSIRWRFYINNNVLKLYEV
jgi:hypothetical protein